MDNVRTATWSQDSLMTSVEPKFMWLVPKFFPTVKLFTTSTVEFDIVEGGRRIAPFVTPWGLGRSSRRNGFRTYAIKPAYVKLDDTITPDEGFSRMPGEAYGGTQSPMQRIAKKEAQQIADHREMIETRWEAMAAEALVTGKLTISVEGFPESVVDFERDPNLDLVAALPWSNIAADPMDDLQVISDRITKSSKGANANTIIMRTAGYDALAKNPKFRELFDRNKNISGQQNSGMELGLRNSDRGPQLRGRLASNMDLWTYDGFYDDDAGMHVPFLPEEKALVFSDRSIEGVRYHGAIHDLNNQMQATEIFTKSKDEFEPSGRRVITQSAPMLGIRRANASGVLTIL
jgi:hypothetical protein